MTPFQTITDVKMLFAYTLLDDGSYRISADQNQIEMLTGKEFGNNIYLETDKLFFSRSGMDITVFEKRLSDTFHNFYHDRMRVLIDREDNGYIDEYDNTRWEMVSKMYYGNPFSDAEMFCD